MLHNNTVNPLLSPLSQIHQPSPPLPPAPQPFERKKVWINLGFRETAHLPLPQANIKTYFSLREKRWLRGGVGGLLPISLK